MATTAAIITGTTVATIMAGVTTAAGTIAAVGMGADGDMGGGESISGD